MRLLIVVIAKVSLLLAQLALAQSKRISINLDRIPTERLHPIQIIDDGGEPLFSSTVNITSDPYENKLYIGNTDEIIVISLQDNHIKRFGRRGQGPGEFRMIARIGVSETNIFVADVPNGRVHIFDKRFNYIRSLPVNGYLKDIAVVNSSELIIHTLSASRSRGFLLHKYHVGRPLRPVRSFLQPVLKFNKIPANVLTMNGLTIAHSGECLYVQYRVLPLQRIFCNDMETFIELRFSGQAVERLYAGVGGAIRTASGATPAIVFSPRIVVGEDGYLYWLVVVPVDRVFVLEPSTQRLAESYFLQSESDEDPGDYTDFCVVNQLLYVCDTRDGTIHVYHVREERPGP